MDYSSRVVQHTYAILAGTFVLGYYTNDEECMFTSVPDHIVDCNDLV